MADFKTELAALVIKWLKLGDDPESMAMSLEKETHDLYTMVDTAPPRSPDMAR